MVELTGVAAMGELEQLVLALIVSAGIPNARNRKQNPSMYLTCAYWIPLSSVEHSPRVRPSMPMMAECPKYVYTPSKPDAFATATYT